MSSIDNTLAERGKRYGEFAGHAKITQDIKSLFHNHTKWFLLADDQKEALEMIAHKLGRIFNGDPHYDDSWIDVAGYAKLVADRLSGPQEPNKVANILGAIAQGSSRSEADAMAANIAKAAAESDKVMQTKRHPPSKSLADLLGSFQRPAAGKVEAKNPDEECQCPGCTMNRLVASSKGKDLSLDDIEAMFPGLNIVIVTSSSGDEQT